MGIIFGLARKTIRYCASVVPAAKAKSAWLELEPLKNVRSGVSRSIISLCSALRRAVAVAAALSDECLWSGHKVAGMIAAFFSFPASVFRAYGGHLSDRFGARP